MPVLVREDKTNYLMFLILEYVIYQNKSLYFYTIDPEDYDTLQ
jgi:hypothetical protein